MHMNSKRGKKVPLVELKFFNSWLSLKAFAFQARYLNRLKKKAVIEMKAFLMSKNSLTIFVLVAAD